MSELRQAPVPFRLRTPSSGPRFLGLPVSERNRRVARRAGAVDETDTRAIATLTVPADVALTPAALAALPAANGEFELQWRDGRPPLVWSDGGTGSNPRRVSLPAGSVLDVSTPAARRQSAWTLLNASGKPADGWLSRHLHRKISRLFSYVFLRAGLSANIATILTFFVGAVGAWFMAQTSHITMIVGTLLYWGSSIADGIDGEMARLTLSESAFGEQLDTGVDQATHLLAIIGAGVGWWRQGFGAGGVVLAVVVITGVPLTLMWAMALVRRARRTSQFFVVTKPIELAVAAAARQTGALPLKIAAAIFVLFRREAFSCTFFLISLITGLRAVVPAVIAVSLAIIAATLVLYKKPVNAALESVVRR